MPAPKHVHRSLFDLECPQRGRSSRTHHAHAGLRFDREWMVVKDSGQASTPSKFLSQREVPKLALVSRANDSSRP